MEKPLGSSVPRTLEKVCDPRHMGSFWRSQPTTPNFHCRAGGPFCLLLLARKVASFRLRPFLVPAAER